MTASGSASCRLGALPTLIVEACVASQVFHWDYCCSCCWGHYNCCCSSCLVVGRSCRPGYSSPRSKLTWPAQPPVQQPRTQLLLSHSPPSLPSAFPFASAGPASVSTCTSRARRPVIALPSQKWRQSYCARTKVGTLASAALIPT